MKEKRNLVQIKVESSSDKGRVDDPRELATILQYSLRDLFGDLEPHSCQLDVVSDNQSGNNGRFLVTCLEESAQAMRGALTWVTPPPYIETNIYRFDVLSVTKL
jgi:RNase P/RNase MRP subunit POP5